MVGNKVKLFQTVADMYNDGKIDLSASDRNVIEKETQDLIRKSMFSRHAEKMPEGFNKILKALKESESPDEAFDMIVKYLKEEGVIKDKEKGDKGDKKDKEKGDKDSDKLPDFMKKDKKKEKGEESEEEHESKETHKEEHEEHGMGEEEGEEDEEEMIRAARRHVINMAKRIRSQETNIQTPSMPVVVSAPDREMKRKRKEDKGKGESKLDKIMKDEDEKGSPNSNIDEMGLDRDQVIRAKRSRITITPEMNIVARDIHRGPMFIGIPNDETKNNRKELIRLANKVKSIIVYEGWKTAAKVCNAKLVVAGVDEDVMTVTDKTISPETDPSTAGGDTLTRDKVEVKKPPTVVEGVEVVTEEKPNPKTSRIRRIQQIRRRGQVDPQNVYEMGRTEGYAYAQMNRPDHAYDPSVDSTILNEIFDEKGYAQAYANDPTKVDSFANGFSSGWNGYLNDSQLNQGTTAGRNKARRVPRRGGVADNGVVLHKDEAPPKTTDELGVSVTDESENVQSLKPKGPSDSSLTKGDVDFKTSRLEQRYRKLYTARAEKAVQDQVEAFARKFTKCIKIASARMKLNHTPHLLKASMVDVLTASDGLIEFTNGDKYRGMDDRTAIELTELVASEGHDRFVDGILADAANLLEKSDAYLNDVESDLSNLTPKSVEASMESVEDDYDKPRSRKASNIRKRMSDGNFNMKVIEPPVQVQNKIGNKVGNALSDSTKLGRRLSNYTGSYARP